MADGPTKAFNAESPRSGKDCFACKVDPNMKAWQEGLQRDVRRSIDARVDQAVGVTSAKEEVVVIPDNSAFFNGQNDKRAEGVKHGPPADVLKKFGEKPRTP